MSARKKRAMSSEKAKRVRAEGHADAKLFAQSIGLKEDYQNDPKAKKDVIDKKGDSHSVKSGKKFWQIFLYSLSRFKNDNAFKAMNGIGQIMIDCITAIPLDKEEYNKDKNTYKQEISKYMLQLEEKLQETHMLRAFLEKSIFNGGEVNYLTIKYNDVFHIFYNTDVIDVLANNLEVSTSKAKARSRNGIPHQKVLLKLYNKNCGEIEMRNGENNHHREMKFRLHKLPITTLLTKSIGPKETYNENVMVYGKAIKKFLKKTNH